MLELIKLFTTLLPIVKPLVVQIVKHIAGAENQEQTAARLLEEAMRLRAFDERMRARSPKA